MGENECESIWSDSWFVLLATEREKERARAPLPVVAEAAAPPWRSSGPVARPPDPRIAAACVIASPDQQHSPPSAPWPALVAAHEACIPLMVYEEAFPTLQPTLQPTGRAPSRAPRRACASREEMCSGQHEAPLR